MMLLGLAASFASIYGARYIPSQVIVHEKQNIWFEADMKRVYYNMCYQFNVPARTEAHPLFVLLTWPIVNSLRSIFSIDSVKAVKCVIAQVAGFWIVVFYALLRFMGCRRLDATLFSVLAAISAAAMFWFVVPETFPFGSLTILWAMVVVARSQHRRLSEGWYVAASAATLSMTLTNWMTGIVAAFTNHTWRRATQITINAFCLVVILWAIQRQFLSVGDFFLSHHGEERFLVSDAAGGLSKSMISFFFHSIVMPAFEEIDRLIIPGRTVMLTQQSMPGSATGWGLIAVILWSILLMLGLWGMLSSKQNFRLRLTLGLTVIGQLVLHTVYGWETFLYAIHFGPLLVILTAWGTFTRARRLVLTIVAAIILCAGVNNVLQFNRAVDFCHHQTLSSLKYPNADR